MGRAAFARWVRVSDPTNPRRFAALRTATNHALALTNIKPTAPARTSLSMCEAGSTFQGAMAIGFGFALRELTQ